MRRSKRASTVKNSLDVESKLADGKNKQKKRSSPKPLHRRETIELSSRSREVDLSLRDTEEDTVFIEEENDYWIDSAAYSFTEVVSPASPFPRPIADTDRWSTSINRFAFDTGIAVDIEAEPTVGSFPLLSPRNMAAMNDAEYNRAYMKIDDCVVNIETLISMFNKDTVTLLDLGTYREEIQTIFQSFTKLETKYLDLRGKLNRDNEIDILRLTTLKELHERMKKRVRDNQVEVKLKIEELQNANPHNATKDADRVSKDKIELKVKHAVDKFKDLKKSVADHGKVEDMSEQKIRECIQETKEWKKDMRTYRDTKENIDLELVSVEIDAELKADLENNYKEMMDSVSKMISDLDKSDKDLGLYALTDSKPKSTVEYPDPFTGLLGENVFKFIKEFEEAIAADRIRKADEVKTLIKYLKGGAKLTIGEHHSTLSSAIEQLKDNYGSPRLIVDKYLRDFEKNLGHIRNWGKHGSKERADAINKTLDFLRNLENLVSDHPDHLKAEIYSSSTLVLLTKGMPHEFSKKLNERCSHKDSYESWFTTVFDILEENKSTNLSALSTGIGAAKGSSIDHGSGTSSNKSNYLKHNGHDCTKSNTCKDRWELLGCVNLYKLTTVEDRENFLRERRGCFKCGKTPFIVKNQKKHFCVWKNGKMDARCTGKSPTGGRCWKAAAMCTDHPDNATDVLKDWLQAQKITFTVNIIVANVETDDAGYYKRLQSELPSNPISEKVFNKAVSRDSLQSGDAAQMMNNDEILDFFTSDMRRVNSKSKVHGIPWTLDFELTRLISEVKKSKISSLFIICAASPD